jgi:hypothetical protein
MLEKLGIGDCFPPPPPARPRLKKEADYENEDDASGEWPDVPSGRRLAPAVPVGGARPIGESMEIVLEDFPSFAEAAEEIEDAGCPWLWLAEEMLGDTVGAAEMEALKGCLTQAWFAMVPVGAFVRSISVECIQENFDKIFDDFEEGQPEPERVPKPLTSAFQDALVQGTFTLLNVTLQGQKPDSAALFDCWVFLKAAIDELHEALEEQNRSGR